MEKISGREGLFCKKERPQRPVSHENLERIFLLYVKKIDCNVLVAVAFLCFVFICAIGIGGGGTVRTLCAGLRALYAYKLSV